MGTPMGYLAANKEQAELPEPLAQKITLVRAMKVARTICIVA
jgi:hypothetical protein